MSNVAKLKKRALDYEQKKQFDKALDTYMQVLGTLGEHIEEADVALFNRVGDLLLRQGNVASAVDHYERAVDLYTEGGFHNNAIALCNKILRNAPGRSSIYYKLGRISAKKGFANDAKQNFLEYADRMQRIGQFEEAFRALKEFADLCPDQDDIRLMLADQLVRGDRKAEAIDQLQFLFNKFEAEGRTQEAHATMERMKAIDPDHEPKPGVARPTPKVNDLIFLDVNYDGREHARGKSPDRAGPSPASAPAVADVAESTLEHHDADVAESTLEHNDAEVVHVTPLPGLSSGATFGDAAGDMDTAPGADGIVSHTDDGFITGFEETSLGGIDLDMDTMPTIAPIAGIEQSSPVPVNDDGESSATGDPESANQRVSAEGADGASDGLVGDDDLPMIDISLDLIGDAPSSSGSELTFIFPDDDGTLPARAEWNAEPDLANTMESKLDVSDDADIPAEAPERPMVAMEDLRLEPLLQLPEIAVEAELPDQAELEESFASDAVEEPTVNQLSEEPPISLLPKEPPISQGAGELYDQPDDQPEDEPNDSESIGPELQFLSFGDEEPADEHSPNSSEIVGFEHLEIGVPEPAGIDAPAAPVRAADAIRSLIELDPRDWELHRRLAEALLEEGDRSGGLAALEEAMLGFERGGDIRSANVLVDEMIRVEPSEVRFHQKRVEYAVRLNDRSLLADAYFSLADSLFKTGDLDKSRAVYARVLELSPGDERARSALGAIGAAAPSEAEAEPEIMPRPSANGVAREALSQDPPPMPRAKAPEPESVVAGDYVNLSDWLREDEPTRNTRMVVDVKEPEIQEQVDFAEMLSMFKQGVAANVEESDYQAHYDLGVAYKEMGLLDEAISEFQKALRGTEQRVRTYEALGQCFVEKGQHQIAVTILSRALGDKSFTDDMLVGVLYLLGYASETLGRWPDAQRFYERVFGVDIEFRDIRQRLAIAERGGR